MAKGLIEKRNLDEEIYDLIIGKIINSDFEQGQQLRINDLIQEFGVSRTPIVQAIKKLVSEDILVVNKTGKVFLPVFSQKQIQDIYDVRMMLEKGAVAHLCAIEDRSRLVQALRTQNDRCRVNLECAEVEAYRREDLQLHRDVVNAVGNHCLFNSYIRVQNLFMVANYLSGSHNMNQQRQSLEEHEVLIDAIEAGDSDGAARAVEIHIRGALERVGIGRASACS